jgi:glycerol kinase
MPAEHILAIDQGTTSSRALVFDQQGVVKGSGQRVLPQIYPADGWVEHDPHFIWSDTVAVCRRALESAGLAPADLAGIGITNQRETTLLWERATGKPLHNAIVWQDRRTAGLCARLRREGHEEMVRKKSGLLLDPYFSATKLAWLLDELPGARRRAEKGELAFGTVDSYLLFRLTGGQVHATDASNASRTMLFNLPQQRWDPELLELFNIPEALLPEVKDNSAFFGEVKPDLFGAALPILGMAGDQQAALVGQACFEPGMIKCTYGTGAFALLHTGERVPTSNTRLLSTVAYRLGGRAAYALEGSIFVAGAALKWLRDGLGIIADASESAGHAAAVADTGGVYLVPAFTGLGAPYWDPGARGALLGLTLDTSKSQVVRAALEAQAYQTRDLMEAMAADAGGEISRLRVDGGMVKNDWLCQYLADITGLLVERPVVAETTALGAAYLAGLQAGLYDSLQDVAGAWRRDRVFEPMMDQARRDELYAGWQEAVERVKSRKEEQE